jgi:hypothetical protein
MPVTLLTLLSSQGRGEVLHVNTDIFRGRRFEVNTCTRTVPSAILIKFCGHLGIKMDHVKVDGHHYDRKLCHLC